MKAPRRSAIGHACATPCCPSWRCVSSAIDVVANRQPIGRRSSGPTGRERFSIRRRRHRRAALRHSGWHTKCRTNRARLARPVGRIAPRRPARLCQLHV